MLPVAIIARRALYRTAYPVLKVWWFVRRPHTEGVKVVLRDGDAAVFVRHSYGDRASWELPGGGRRRGESAVDAARREAREELGVVVGELAHLGRIAHRDYATAHLDGFMVDYDGQPLAPDLGELAEVRWAPLASPPQPLGPYAATFLEIVLRDDA